MNREGLESFLEFAGNNQEHKDKIRNLTDVEAMTDYARSLGYDVSAEELQRYKDKTEELLKARLLKAQGPEVSLSPGTRDFYALINLAETDAEVDKRLGELAAGTKEELIAYGREKGFNFDEKDIEGISESILEPSDELSDEELEMAAGGTTLAAVGVGAMVVLGVGLVAAVVMFAVRR